MISRRPLAALVAAILPLAAPAAELLRYVPAAKSARHPEHLVTPTPVTVDRAAIEAAGQGGTLDLALPTGKRVKLRIDRIERHENGDVSWTGRVADGAHDLAAVGTTGSVGTYAEIETADGKWGLVPAQADHDWLFDKSASEAAAPPQVGLDDFRVPPREFSAHPKATCPTVAAMPSQMATLDVLAVITPDFVSTHGGAAGAETRLNNIFATINSYNAASNVAITYRRVGTINVAYQAASTAGDDDGAALDAITGSAGTFANVAALRNFFGADMVAMFRGPKSGGNSISGIAWLNGDNNGNMPSGDANYMYSVSGDWTLGGAIVAAHELGHNLGNAHDRPNAGSGTGSTPYSFGHYVCGSGASSTCGQAGSNNTGTGFGTIMSYHLPRVGKWSSPSLSCRGPNTNSLTAPCGVHDQQDDVRASNCVRLAVANFRHSWIGCNLATDSDRDGIPDCLEANSGRNNGARDNDIFGNALLFSAQQYRDFLSREADADGLNYWTTAISRGTSTRPALVESFINSAEFQGYIAPVARLYFAYFLRIPDYAGLQYWIGRFKSDLGLAAISEQFAASPEFNARYGALSNAQFVTLVYANVLGRAPDAAGQTYWTGRLNSGMSRGDLMAYFSESPEYRALVNNEVYVTMAYMGMLRRAPDPGGFSHWLAYLDSGHSGQALLNAFVTSAEYRGRFLP